MGTIRNKTAVITMETSILTMFKQMSKSMLIILFNPHGVVDHKLIIIIIQLCCNVDGKYPEKLQMKINWLIMIIHLLNGS
jgi:hypothetical protein